MNAFKEPVKIETPFVERQSIEIDECVICQESQLNHKTITLEDCSHVFHLSCLQSWAILSNKCPLCRKTFSEGHELQKLMPILLASAFLFPIEEQLQRLTFAFTTVKLILEKFKTSNEYDNYKSDIISFSESFNIDNYKLPLLCYTTRNDLYKELKVLKERYTKLLEYRRQENIINRIPIERHPLELNIYIRCWKQRISEDFRLIQLFSIIL